jgi:putative hemolysin
MVAEVLRLDVRPVRTIMTPRTDVVWLDVADDQATLLRKLSESDHSRFPVCDRTLNNVVGVVAAKRLLRQVLQTGQTDIRQAMVAPLIIPESMPVLELLERFKAARPHMAVIVDEYADVQGVVTPTDVLETIAGDFTDQQGGPPTIIQREDGSWLIDARVELQELADRLGFSAPGDDPYVSLAAFLLRVFQRIPTEGEIITVDGWRFEIADMDGRRIDKVLIMRLNQHLEDMD